MIFSKHLNLAGKHAFLAPSKYAWMNYDDDKMDRVFFSALAAQRGTELHALAHELIRLGVKLPRMPKTLNLYVNDGIGFRMTPEQPLFFSENCFGTADAISFRRNSLRISDLKTGVSPTSEHQLEVYAALFCLEYHMKPFEIDTELRIYQNDECRIYEADPDILVHIMEKIKFFDKRITALRMETEG